MLQDEVQKEICGAQATSLDAERKIQQDKRFEKKDKLMSLHTASTNSVLQKYSVWRRRRLATLTAERKHIQKMATLPARALAIKRLPQAFPRGCGQLHWQQPLPPAERRKLVHAGDPAGLAAYIAENDESLKAEASALRAHAKQRRRIIEDPLVPVTNSQWLRFLDTHEEEVHGLLRESHIFRRKYSQRLQPLEGLLAASPLVGRSEKPPSWVRNLSPSKMGPFFLFVFPNGSRLACMCGKVGTLVFGFRLANMRSAQGVHQCLLDLRDLHSQCRSLSELLVPSQSWPLNLLCFH